MSNKKRVQKKIQRLNERRASRKLPPPEEPTEEEEDPFPNKGEPVGEIPVPDLPPAP